MKEPPVEEEVSEKLPDIQPGKDTLRYKPEEIDKRTADHTSDEKCNDVGDEKKLNSGG